MLRLSKGAFSFSSPATFSWRV